MDVSTKLKLRDDFGLTIVEVSGDTDIMRWVGIKTSVDCVTGRPKTGIDGTNCGQVLWGVCKKDRFFFSFKDKAIIACLLLMNIPILEKEMLIL